MNKNNTFTTHFYSTKEKIYKIGLDENYFKINNLYSLTQLLKIIILHIFSIIIFPFLIYTLPILGFIIGFLFMGVAAYKFQFIIHECCHSNFFSNKKINDSVGSLVASMFGINLESYRKIHFEHHKYSNTYEDPQFVDALNHKNKNLKKIDLIKFIISPILFQKFILFLRREIYTALKLTNNNFNNKNYIYLFFSILINLSIFIYIYAYTKNIFLSLSYHLSLITISLFLARFRTLAEHQYKFQEEVPAEFVMSHKKNILDSIFFYDLNFNYHFEHHLFPRMYFRNLNKFSQKYRNIIHERYNTLSKSMFITLFNRIRRAS